MPIAFRSVSRSKHTIRFNSRVNDKAFRDFVPLFFEALERGHTGIILDFRPCDRAYAEAVLPLICFLDHHRRQGTEFRAVLPESQSLRQLFLNANWAHYLDPNHEMHNLEGRHHLPARRYVTHPEQQAAVRAAIDVVVRNMNLDRDVWSGLEWSTNEITDNVLNHAQSPDGGIVQVSTFREECKVQIVVADAGRGIPAAMREAFSHLRNDEAAIDEAMKAGVTSIPDSGQGNGLAGTLRIATAADGAFKVMSGKARLNVFRDPRSKKYRTVKGRGPEGRRFPGTVVMVEMSTTAKFAIEEALSLSDGFGGTPLDMVDLHYTDESGNLVVVVAEEALSCGTRHAGVELRRKCQNLLSADPTKRLILDWGGVPLVSSSFADEAVGKLFVELGPTTFSSRVSHARAEPLVRSLLDRAVMQRVAQAMQGDAYDGGT